MLRINAKKYNFDFGALLRSLRSETEATDIECTEDYLIRKLQTNQNHGKD